MTNPLQISFNSKSLSEKTIPDKMQLDIFRIVQEQLNNIVKHSSAVLASIQLTAYSREIILIISDNGKGCNLSLAKEGVGLINIHSRIERHGGKVIFISAPGKGFALKANIPLS